MDGELLSETFVELTDTLVAGFDVIDFLHVLTDRSVQLLDVSAAGLLLADPRGELRVVAASSEAARLLELFQIQNDQGPCLDCFRSGRPVAAADLAAAATRWPRFAPAARQAGFAAVQALPMRLREQVIGALNLFRADPGALPPADIRVPADPPAAGRSQQPSHRTSRRQRAAPPRREPAPRPGQPGPDHPRPPSPPGQRSPR
jgi:transcriptional regulator with GAF, ATPase, and Fis domain